MWVELLCGLVIYKIITRFFSEDEDDIAVESSDSTALFTVAERFSYFPINDLIFLQLLADFATYFMFLIIISLK